MKISISKVDYIEAYSEDAMNVVKGGVRHFYNTKEEAYVDIHFNAKKDFLNLDGIFRMKKDEYMEEIKHIEEKIQSAILK